MVNELLVKKLLANISELEIYIINGNETIKKESEIALSCEKLREYNETKKIDYLISSEDDIKSVNNYLEKKLMQIRDIK